MNRSPTQPAHPRAAVPQLPGLLWRRFTWRHWRRTPGQTALLLSILALGIAVYFSIRLANRAAVAGFSEFTEAITGQSDFVLSAPAGSLDEAWLGEIRRGLGAEPVTLVPVVEASAAEPRHRPDGKAFGRQGYSIIGIDLVAAANLVAGRSRRGSFFDRTDAPTARGSAESGILAETLAPARVWISPALARERDLKTGDELSVVINDRVVTLNVAGLIPVVEGLPPPAQRLLVLDLPEVQRLDRRPDQIDRIEVLVPPGPSREERRQRIHNVLTKLAAGRWLVETPGSRQAAGETMTAAFRLNLTVLSLIALLVGVLLILQALDGAVVRRRNEIAVLRALGVEARAIRRAWMTEAAILGVIGGIGGALLGWAAAQWTVRLVGRTVNALYYASAVRAAELRWGELAAALALGVGASVMAGWMPARTAARTPPVSLLAHGAAPGPDFLRHPSAAAGLLLLGALLYFVPPWRTDAGGRVPIAGYATALCWIAGAGALAGSLLPVLSRMFAPAGRRGVAQRIAISHLREPTGRHRLALAGLITAVGMTAGMILLVASFETTVRHWIAASLQGDLFVASDAAQDASAHGRLPPQTWRALAHDPVVAAARVSRSIPIRLEERPTVLTGTEVIGGSMPSAHVWIAPPAKTAGQPAAPADTAYVSESFTERFRVRRGDRITIPTPAGPQQLQILGVYSDYGHERGAIEVPRDRLARWFADDSATSLALALRPGEDPGTVRARWLAAHPALRILTHRGLREAILAIFRQTFSITYALEFIGVIVAVAGLALSLASMLLDRREELTVLRALGFAPGEMARAAAWEGAAVALVGVLAGTALGLALGRLLIFVINKQSFGWTLQSVVPWTALSLLALTVVLAGATVAWLVGRRAAALPADQEE